VTNYGWDDFWLNEGFTVYIERRIISKMNGEKYGEFESILGYDSLIKTINSEMEEKFTSLYIDHTGIDPDEAFSKVAYEKGYYFLYYLSTIVGGHSEFERFLKSYFEEFKYKSITHKDFKKYFLEFYKEKEEIKGIEWDQWFYKTGKPIIEIKYDDTLIIEIEEQYEILNQDYEKINEKCEIIKTWKTNQILHLLNKFIKKKELPTNFLTLLNEKFEFTKMNFEIKNIFFDLCLKNDCLVYLDEIDKFLSEQGRMKFVRPIYKSLYLSKNGKDHAINIFKKYQNRYHSIAIKMIKLDLNLS
jgi:leukotriene-A4 hydrolase